MCLQVLTSSMMRQLSEVHSGDPTCPHRSFGWQIWLWFRWFFQRLLDVTFKSLLQDQGQVLLGRCDNYASQFFKRSDCLQFQAFLGFQWGGLRKRWQAIPVRMVQVLPNSSAMGTNLLHPIGHCLPDFNHHVSLLPGVDVCRGLCHPVAQVSPLVC